MKQIKVLVVDDSKLVRHMIQEFLKNDPDIEVVGAAADAYEARDLIKKTNPDVITLDIMMPGMDGITFLKNLMRLHPLPVIMLSALTKKNSEIALEALANGAVEYLEKPSPHEMKSPSKYIARFKEIIKNAATSNVKMRPLLEEQHFEIKADLLKSADLLRDEVIVIGASTGGIEAIETMLPQFPRFFPPVLIAQHIRKEFNSVFLKRMSKLTRLDVVEAQQGLEIVPGKIYLAIAGYHLIVKKSNNRYYCAFDNAPATSAHKPSVDVLFDSVAKTYGAKSIGVLLTGMGADGARGLQAIKEVGGSTIAQDEHTSVVWGMPGTAVKMGAAEYVTPISEIVQVILQILDKKARQNSASLNIMLRDLDSGTE